MQSFNVLISSGGRRISLMRCFREAIAHAGCSGRVLAVDNSPTAPAFHLADQAWTVPSCSDESFVERVLELAVRQQVNLIVPTIDPELPIYARHRERFLAQGVAVSVGDERAIQIASDKWKTYQWLTTSGLPTARTALAEEVLADQSSWPLPLIVKPRRGSASVGVATISHFSELEMAVRQRNDLIVQEIAQGVEYTINLYVDLAGKCLASVPHRRIQTRGGEVAKGITTKNSALIELGRSVAEKLPGMRGAMNVQCFLSTTGEIRIIELNARFGGGYPLAHQAGARFAHWLVDETLGGHLMPALDSWTDQLMMVRYDQELFLEAKDTAHA